MISIYTDGFCLGDPGPGGYCALIIRDTNSTFIGSEEVTTNNRMEIQAVIAGLQNIGPEENVTIYSDSLYVINTMSKGWRRNVNHDLWDQLDNLISQRNAETRWKWVKGHSGNPNNEIVDSLAYEAACQMRDR